MNSVRRDMDLLRTARANYERSTAPADADWRLSDAAK